MSAALARLRPVVAILERDFLVATSYRVRFVTGLLSGFVNLVIFYYVSRLVHLNDALSPDAYFAFVTVGIMIFSVVTATLATPHTALRQELVAGTFERMLLAPGGTIVSVVSLLLFPALYAVLTAAALLTFAVLVFGIDLQWSTAALGLPLAALAVVAFAPFGVLLQASVVVGKKAPPGADYIILGMSLAAGLYFPISLLPSWVRWASQVEPLTPAVNLLRWALMGQPLAHPLWLELARLVGFAAVILPLSLAILSMVLRVARRRGTILEY